MPTRKTGYHYVKDKNGARHRVYNKAIKGRGAYSMGRSMSRARALYGKGGYYDSGFVKSMNEYIPKGSFAGLGKVVGGPLGGIAGHALGKLLGFGAYNLKSNSIMVSEGNSPPAMHSTDSSLKVRHREYITDIISNESANTFNLQSFPIQPGIPTSYPWLSAIASQYEEHKPLGIVYEFKTLSATAISSSTNTTMGGIIMATDYNSTNAAFVNKQQMDNTEYTTSGPVWESFFHPVECDPRTNPISSLYVRSGAPPSNSDLRLYDLGLFQIASFGVQGTSVVLGELWVTYEWEFRKPISTSALGQDVLSDHFQLTSVTNAHPLGAAQSAGVSGSSLGGSITNTIYSFNPLIQEGQFLVIWTVVGDSTAVASPSFTFTNCKKSGFGQNMWFNDTSGTVTNNGTTAVIYIMCFILTITAQNATITIGTGGTLPANASAGDLVVTQYDTDIVT